jgi:hypothetical protein
VAKGVGERAEQPEGLYLGCQPRYSPHKRDSRDEHHGRDVLDKKNNEVMGDAGRKVIDVCEQGCVAFFSVTLLVTLFCVKSP